MIEQTINVVLFVDMFWHTYGIPHDDRRPAAELRGKTLILSNHYHLLVDFVLRGRSGELSEAKFAPPTPEIAPKEIIVEFIRKLHKDSARKINEFDNTPGRQVWYQYWDHCIRTEKDFWEHFNYIHHNPVKHKIYSEQSLVANYPFCSYQSWLKKEGQEWIDLCFATYPIIDFTCRGDDF